MMMLLPSFFGIVSIVLLLSGASQEVAGFSTSPIAIHGAPTPSSCSILPTARKRSTACSSSSWSDTRLFGCRSRRRNRHKKDHDDDRLATTWNDIPTRKSCRLVENIFDSLDAFDRWHYVHKQRRRRRKHLWILYTVGFIATFPIGPLIFLAIRNRHAIRQDLGLLAMDKSSSSSSNNNNWRMSSTSTPQDDDNADLIEQSRQVDKALRDSMDVVKSIREGITFDETLVQRFDNQIEQLHSQAKTVLSNNNERTEADEMGEAKARQYLEERQTLKAKKEKLEQKIRDERQRLQAMEDNVWSLQTRSMELNEQMRGEVTP